MKHRYNLLPVELTFKLYCLSKTGASAKGLSMTSQQVGSEKHPGLYNTPSEPNVLKTSSSLKQRNQQPLAFVAHSSPSDLHSETGIKLLEEATLTSDLLLTLNLLNRV
jgi:hypothetical protein